MPFNSRVILDSTTVRDNRTGDGISGNFTAGAGGEGGGIYMSSGKLLMTDCQILGNISGAGLTDDNESGNGGNGGGDGGGIWSSGMGELIRCTVAENFTGSGGASSDAGTPGDGGGGGGIYWDSDENHTIRTEIASSTVARNEAGIGGGIRISSGSGNALLELRYSVVAQNVAGSHPDILATVLSHSNVDFYEQNFLGALTDTNTSGSPTGNAMLMALSDYGGPTLTMPRPGSMRIAQGVLVFRGGGGRSQSLGSSFMRHCCIFR